MSKALRNKNKLNNIVSVTDFGAVGDGVTDDTAALNLAAAHEGVVVFPPGVFTTTTGVVLSQGCRWIGAGNWSGVSSLYSDVGTTVIKYTGTLVVNSCVIRVASLAVGTEGAAINQLQNVGLEKLTVDGNDTAEFGIYFNRSWSNNKFDHLTVTGTRKHGFWAGNCWNGSPTNWHAFKNIGCGITLGVNTFTWSQCTVDQSTCTSFFGYYSGHNASTVTQNAFADATPALEYGIGVGNGRALVLTNPQANECSGAGLYLPAATLGPITIVGGYFENNGRSSGATRRWDLWYECGTSTLNTTINGSHFGVASTGAIRITGSPNTSRREGALKLVGIPILPTIDASHAYYRLIDCDRDPTAMVGTAPMYFGGRVNDAQNLNPIGLIVFHTTTGAITTLRKEGAVAGVSYTSTGEFVLTLTETQANSTWIAQCSTAADNRYVRAHTYNTTSCSISHKSLTNTVQDPEGATNAIRVMVYPAYA